MPWPSTSSVPPMICWRWRKDRFIQRCSACSRRVGSRPPGASLPPAAGCASTNSPMRAASMWNERYRVSSACCKESPECWRRPSNGGKTMQRLINLFWRRRIYTDLAEEMQEHLQEKVEELVSGGMSRQDAEAAARREFGNATVIEERSREVWRWGFLDDIFRDVRIASRQLRRNP